MTVFQEDITLLVIVNKHVLVDALPVLVSGLALSVLLEGMALIVRLNVILCVMMVVVTKTLVFVFLNVLLNSTLLQIKHAKIVSIDAACVQVSRIVLLVQPHITGAQCVSTIVWVVLQPVIRTKDALPGVQQSIIKLVSVIQSNAIAVLSHATHARVLHSVTSVNRNTGEVNVNTTAPGAVVHVIKTKDVMLAARPVFTKV